MIQKINLGASPNDKTGDKARVAGQKINDNFDYLEGKIDNKTYLKIETGFSLTAQNLTVNAGWQWMINGVDYTNPVAVVIAIPLATTGKSRIDLVVCNTSNTFNLVAGVESVSTPVASPLPTNTVMATFFTVTDGTISVPVQPIIGDAFITKLEKANGRYEGSGVLDNFEQNHTRSCLKFQGAITELKSISFTGTNGVPYNGKEFIIENNQSIPFDIFHNSGAGGFRFNFPNAQNFTLEPNFRVKFRTTQSSSVAGTFDYIGILPVDISGKLDKATYTGTADDLKTEIDAKLDASAYNNHFKGVYLTEAALNAAHPTGSAGDYAQVNEVGATDVINYNWDAEESIWVKNAVTGSGATNTDALPEGSTNLYFTVARFLTNLTYANVISALGFTPEDVGNKSDSYTASSSTTYASTKALVDGLDTKANKIQNTVYADDYTDIFTTFNGTTGRNDTSAIIQGLNALSALGGGKLILSNKRYKPVALTSAGAYLMDDLTIEGSGSGYYSSDLKTIIGGTIIDGTLSLWGNNITVKNLSIDGGKTEIDLYYGGTAQEGLNITRPVGDITTKKNITIQNVTTLGYSPSHVAHSVLVEDCDRVFLDNITTAYKVYGVVLKSSNVKAGKITSYAHDTFGCIIKADSGYATQKIDIESYSYTPNPIGVTPYVASTLNGAGIWLNAQSAPLKDIHIGSIAVSDSNRGLMMFADGSTISNVQVDALNITDCQSPINKSGLLIDNLQIGQFKSNNASIPAYVDATTSRGKTTINSMIGDTGFVAVEASNIQDIQINSISLKDFTYAYNVVAGSIMQVDNERFNNVTNRNTSAAYAGASVDRLKTGDKSVQFIDGSGNLEIDVYNATSLSYQKMLTMGDAVSTFTGSVYGEVFLGKAFEASLGASNTVGTGSFMSWTNGLTGGSLRNNFLQLNASYGLDFWHYNGSWWSNTGFKINADGSLNLPTPTTSAGTYDFLTRNTSTGVVEKITAMPQSLVTNLTTDLAAKAPLVSPAFTGTPTAPTQPPGTNDNSVATMAALQAVARPYKVYAALLSQTGTDAPVATVLENTLGGTVVWTRNSSGLYIGTLAGVFTTNKTWVSITSTGTGRVTGGVSTDANTVTIATDSVDSALTNSALEIRVYN